MFFVSPLFSGGSSGGFKDDEQPIPRAAMPALYIKNLRVIVLSVIFPH
jgi:hypothetical protein